MGNTHTIASHKRRYSRNKRNQKGSRNKRNQKLRAN